MEQGLREVVKSSYRFVKWTITYLLGVWGRGGARQELPVLIHTWSTKMSSPDVPSIPNTTAIINVDLSTMTTKTDGNVVKIMVPSAGPRRQEGVFMIVEVLKESELPPVKARSNSVAHCLDNSVAYLKLKDDRTGDIVEMGFTVVVFKMCDRKDRDNLTKSAHIARSTSAVATSNINKRKVLMHNAIPMQYRAKENRTMKMEWKHLEYRSSTFALPRRQDLLDTLFAPSMAMAMALDTNEWPDHGEVSPQFAVDSECEEGRDSNVRKIDATSPAAICDALVEMEGVPSMRKGGAGLDFIITNWDAGSMEALVVIISLSRTWWRPILMSTVYFQAHEWMILTGWLQINFVCALHVYLLKTP
ncbi:hypothetical protein C8R44DRAFT_755028 [Mycena epipterygia]|nr:hypothetical protein C8R44DRAFT_755028 [Mycena epipterygia]